MTRRVVLCEPYWSRDKDPRTPLGQASLFAALERVEGVEVRALAVAVNERPEVEAVADALMIIVEGRSGDEVDLAFGVYVWGEELLFGLLPALRLRGFVGRIILGGPQISYSRGGLEALYPDADAFVRGYGEDALCALARTPGRPEIQGVHWAGTEDHCEQAQVDLEALPSPWLAGLIPLEGRRFLRWETQRGCPFKCAFCQHREPGARLKRRSLGRARVDAEIDRICASRVTDVAVLDPIFNQGPRATELLARFAERGFRGHLSLQCRAELLNEGFLDAASLLDVTLEFGLQTIHRDESRAVHRPNNLPKIEWALAEVRRRGIHHEISLIFGLPSQTLRSFEESVQWCLERRVPVIKAFPLLLLRGTALDQERARWGLVTEGGPMGRVVSSDTFDERDSTVMARLSEALKLTEGRHPATLSELREIAARLEPTPSRWRPPSTRSLRPPVCQEAP